MSSRRLAFLFVMDPLGSIDVQADTTFVLMLEAQARGHRVLHADPSDLAVAEGGVTVRARPATLRREPGNHYELGPESTLVVDDAIDVVLQRKDPPVDAEYVTSTQILGLCRRALVLNRPSGILASNEKLYALCFPELMTETLVTRSIPQLVDFMAKVGGDMIVKPLEGRGGEGVFHLRHDDRNLFSILEQSTRFGARRVMAQRYLPAVRQGDKRILLLDGEPLGAILRSAAHDDMRSNIHVGGSVSPATLDDADRRIIAAVAPRLRADGLWFVGLDVIGGRLTEVNVTSPTGIQQMSRFAGKELSANVIDWVERRACALERGEA